MDTFKPKHFLTTFHCVNDAQGSLNFSELLEATDRGDLEVDIQTVNFHSEDTDTKIIASLDSDWDIFHTEQEWKEKYPADKYPKPWNSPERYPCFAKEIHEWEDNCGVDYISMAFLYDVKIIKE